MSAVLDERRNDAVPLFSTKFILSELRGVSVIHTKMSGHEICSPDLFVQRSTGIQLPETLVR